MTKAQLAKKWESRLSAAERVYKKWADRFRVKELYQYYEGYQWKDSGEDNTARPYVVNLIYSTIDSKLPSLVFDKPEFNISPRPLGDEYNMDEGITLARKRQDILNFTVSRKEFNLNEKHELAVLDAFFGFGVLHIGYDSETVSNPYINLEGPNNPLNNLFCKQIPFDHFRVAAMANWDLSEGKWCGYYEYIPHTRLQKKYGAKLKISKTINLDEDSEADQIMMNGKMELDNSTEFTPAGHEKIWHLWDFETKKFILYVEGSAAASGDAILEYEDFKSCGICTLRYGKRRKGWYPLPPVFNWLSPQDEINDIRETHKIHRKRYARKYIASDTVDEEELQKFLYGPDGSVIRSAKINDVIKPIENEQLDTANQQSMIVSYDDFLRVAGGRTEQGRVADRTTATQATINNRESQIRESKDLAAIASFMEQIGYAVLNELKQIKGHFWAEVSTETEGLLSEVSMLTRRWTKVSPDMFMDNDYTLDVKISSVSPIYQQQDKTQFMEFLALITQYEMLAFSPELIREAAYRVGYRNSNVLNVLQKFAQLMALGRMTQLKQQVAMMGSQGPQPTTEGMLPQQQVDASAPPDMQQINNMIFNRTGVQQPE